jgi:hypothetical protein
MSVVRGCGGAARKFVVRLAKRVRIERRRNRPLIATRVGRRSHHRSAPWLTETEIVAALTRAWSVAMIATILLCCALAPSPMRNRATFLQALHEGLTTDPETLQSIDEDEIDPAAAHRKSAPELRPVAAPRAAP